MVGVRKQPLHPPSLPRRSPSSPSIRLARPQPHVPEKSHVCPGAAKGGGVGVAAPGVCRSFGWISSSPVPIDAPVSASVNPPHTKSRKWLQVHFLKGPVPLRRGRAAACWHRCPARTHGDLQARFLISVSTLLLLLLFRRGKSQGFYPRHWAQMPRNVPEL